MAKKTTAAVPPGDEEAVAYLVYDRTTGRIVHTHIVSAADGKPPDETRTLEELMATVADEGEVRTRLTNNDLAQAALLTTRIGDPRQLLAKAVDPDKEALVDLPRLLLEPEKAAIAGDGKASVKIAIIAADRAGRPIKGFSGEVKVGTSRGRLSAKGGVVALKAGKAEITLTSVPETVERVILSARSPSGRAMPGSAQVEFL